MKKTSSVRSRGRAHEGNGVRAAAAGATAKSIEIPNGSETGLIEFTPPSQDEIQLHAYQIWQAEGCPEGRALDHWSRAEQLLEAERRERFRQNLGAFC